MTDAERPGGQEQPAEQPTERPAGQPGGSPAPRSGLRNPVAAVRGIAAGALVLEAIVLLLAMRPVTQVGGPLGGSVGLTLLGGLIVCCLVLAALMRFRWAWPAGLALQGLVVAAGLVQWAMVVLGLAFAGVWWYVLRVRRSVLGGQR
jgi:hypothetical protein